MVTPPKRTPSEEHNYRVANADLEELGDIRPSVEKALRFLIPREPLIFSAGPSTIVAPDGMNVRDLKACLNLCRRELVLVTQGQNRSGGPFPAYDEIYTIVPGMKAALLELLYPPQAS